MLFIQFKSKEEMESLGFYLCDSLISRAGQIYEIYDNEISTFLGSDFYIGISELTISDKYWEYIKYPIFNPADSILELKVFFRE